MSRKSADIFDDFGAVPEIPSDSFVQGDVTRPSSSGQTEVFVVRVPETGELLQHFYISVPNHGTEGRTRRWVKGVTSVGTGDRVGQKRSYVAGVNKDVLTDHYCVS